MISTVSKVVVPVDDQERAKEFWVDRLGFELRRDESYGDERQIEVSPPAQGPLLALTRRDGPRPPARSRRCAAALAFVETRAPECQSAARLLRMTRRSPSGQAIRARFVRRYGRPRPGGNALAGRPVQASRGCRCRRPHAFDTGSV